MQRHLILTAPAGQLGNRLLQMCNFMAFASTNNFVLLNPGFDTLGYAKYFRFMDSNRLGRYPFTSSSSYAPSALRQAAFQASRFVTDHPFVKRLFFANGTITTRPGILPRSLAVHLLLGPTDRCDLDDPADPLLQEMGSSKVIFMGGWMFRAIRSLDQYADEFRTLFTPQDPFLTNVLRQVATARASDDLLVGVHVRHGDYKAHFGGIYYYDLPIYRATMRDVSALLAPRRVRFLISTDNPAVLPAAFHGFDVSFGSGEPLEDMYSLAHCDYILGPPSTFTGWASFWGQRPVYHIRDPATLIRLADFKVFDSRAFVNLDNAFFGSPS